MSRCVSFWFVLAGACIALVACDREQPTPARRGRAAPPAAETSSSPGDRPELIEPPRAGDEPHGGRSVPADIADAELSPAMQWLGRAPSPPVVDPDHRDDVLVRLGDHTVTLADVDLQLRTSPVPGQGLLATPDARQRFAEQAAQHLQLVAEARRRGLQDEPAARFERLIGLASALRLVTYEEAAARAVSDDEVAAFYQANLDEFVRPEVRTAIVIARETREAADTLRDQLLERAPRPAATRVRTFEHEARRLAKTAGTEHVTLEVRAGESSGPLETQLFELADYEIGAVVDLGDEAPASGRYAFAILTATLPARDVSLDEARPQIRQALDTSQAPRAFTELRERLAAEADATRDTAPFAHVQVRKGARTAAEALDIDADHADDVVLTVGETQVDLATAAEGLARWPRLQQQAVLNADRADEYLDRLTELVALAEAARERGLEAHPMVTVAVDRRLAAMLADRVRAEASPAKITDDQVRAYFDSHPEDYRRAERRRAIHAVVDTRADAEALRETLLDKAPDATRARAEALATLSAERSTVETVRQRSGRLPYVSRDDADELGVPEPVRDAAFALQTFELSEPIEVDGKWAIVLVDGVRDEVVVPFDRVQAAIRHELETRPAEEAWEALLERLAGESSPELHPEVLEHVRGAPVVEHGH